MKKAGIILAVFILVLSLSLVAMADTVNVQVKVRVKPKLIITLLTSPTVQFPDIAPEETTELASAIQIQVKSNKSYTYSYTATDFTNDANPSDTFAISYLEYDGGSGYTAYANSGTLGTNEPSGVNNYTYDLRLDVPWTATADATYTASITYSAVQN